ncbi:type II secretion system F family protein [Winogradskyella forsetii]|uniref:type II secretion system F family protein n=1 Tax=Winogradskyella forsetii TaxID=2686077 RepID=UPI0015C15541|nr:type II secretion system F family protein [Winogradskyella forsetii]
MGIDLSSYNKTVKIKSKKTSFLSKEIQFSKGFSDKKKERFYKELAILIQSGIDFKQALEIVIEQYKSKVDKELIGKIKHQVIQGKSLHEAMQSSRKFSAYEYYSVKIGEETRKLDQVLIELQKYFERKIKMRRQLISVFTYPSFVLAVTFGVLYFMMNNVVPMFSSVFKQFGAELPPLTQKIINISHNFSTISGVFIFSLIAIIAFHFFNKKKEWYRRVTSRVVLKTPFFGALLRKIYMSRLSQSLSLLLSAKTPLVTSLDLTHKMIDFYPIESSLSKVKADILKGVALGESLSKYSVYDHKFVSMVKVAEQINKLDNMFERLSEQYNEEIEHQTKMIGVVLEPVIIIIIGLIVGVIMVAMYSPMFDLSKIIG